MPPAQLLQGGGLESLIADVEAQIRERQSQAATDMAAQGRTFPGVKAIRWGGGEVLGGAPIAVAGFGEATGAAVIRAFLVASAVPTG